MARRRHHHEDHVNHEAWAIPYGDLVTLLLAFFVVMYAISSVNTGKYRVLSDSLSMAFSGSPKTLEPIQLGERPRMDALVAEIEKNKENEAQIKKDSAQSTDTAMPFNTMTARKSDLPFDVGVTGNVVEKRAQRQLEGVAMRVEQVLAPLIEEQLVSVRRSDLWLEVQIQSDALFASGSAQLSAQAQQTLRSLAITLADTPNGIRVEGHTDDQPISTLQFPSNWQLSASRATSVITLMQQAGVAPQRMAVVGFGEYQPRESNLTVEGRTANRRVVLIVLADPNESVTGEDLGNRDLPSTVTPAATTGTVNAGNNDAAAIAAGAVDAAAVLAPSSSPDNLAPATAAGVN